VKVEPLDEWQSPVSLIKYPARLNIESNAVNGKVEILFQETEPNIIEGEGAYFLGPCRFAGRINSVGRDLRIAPKTEKEGKGFCRIVAPE
ncbi:MAG: lipocalin family protein, partial [bacterium]